MTERTYLDHGATTPVYPGVITRVAEAMGTVGNASSLHTSGRVARRVVEESREQIAQVLGARPSEVLFTSGGTESDNLAVKGLYRRRVAEDSRRRRIVLSAIEHSAVYDSAESLRDNEGATLTVVPCDQDGLVTPQAVQAALDAAPGGPATVALVAIMAVNNEVGTVQPISQICQVTRPHGIPVHTDAVQAIGHVPFDFAGSGADLAAVSGHKVGGPPGVGLLLARRDAPLQAISHGGGQERQLRSGTPATALIAGLATGVVHAVELLDEAAPRLVRLRDRLLQGSVEAIPGLVVTGAWEPGDAVRRNPANAHVLVPDCDGDSLLFLLDAAGIDCSTGSACHAGVPQPSHVVLAMGYDEQRARGALRLTLGHTSTDADVDRFLAALPEAVDRAQRAHAASRTARRRGA